MRVTGRLLIVSVVTWVAVSAAAETSIRFHGNGVAAPQLDRVKIAIDAPARPADVGAGDFTVELWLRAGAGNGSGACVSGGDGWINGNIVLDRDVYGGGDNGDFGLSLSGSSGVLAFGVAVGGSGNTICGATDVADGAWHHVAATRAAATGALRLFVDGQLDASGSGPSGDASYRDGRGTAYPDSDPFLVLGAEKHDAGAAYPSFSGWLDELRLSTTIRYPGTFTPPAAPFAADAATAALYHFDAPAAGPCTGTVVDAATAPGGPSPGLCLHGGSPAGPTYSAESPFAAPDPPLCSTGPAAGCRAAGKAILSVAKGATPAQDKAVWKWLRGAATALGDLGDPVGGSSDYALCLYDGAALVASPGAGAGAGWRALGGQGFAYALGGAPDGLAKLVVRAGTSDRARALARGGGAGLGLPATLPFGASPVVAQLVNRDGTCWTSTFVAPSASGPTRFKAKSPP